MFPSGSNEEQGWWVGIATHVGDALTCKILTKHNKVIYRSAIRSALDPANLSNYLGDKTLFDHLNVQMILKWNVIQVSIDS